MRKKTVYEWYKLILVSGYLLIFCEIAVSSNGLKLISSGTRSASMGGADIADSTDSSGLNINPSVITGFSSPRADVHSGTVFLYGLAHHDQFGSDRVANKTGQLVDLSYASKIDEYPLFWGVGLFITGGYGVEYEDINTPFNTQDDLTSTVGLVSLVPSLAYKVNQDLSIGASFVAMYITAEQKFFPETSVNNAQDPGRSFFGSRFEDADDVGYGFKAGLQYKLNDKFTLGAIYNSKINLNPTGDNFKLNLESTGLGVVEYDDLELSGLNFPEEIGFGLAYYPNQKLTLMMDISWLNWSSAVKRSSLTASNPNNSAAPQQISNSADLLWKDQYVFAIGAAYQLSPEIELRAGYNYARAPVRKETLSPLLSPHAEHHLGFGLGKKLKNGWNVDLATVYIFNSKIKYTNEQLPFGANAQEEGETIQFEFTLGYEF